MKKIYVVWGVPPSLTNEQVICEKIGNDDITDHRAAKIAEMIMIKRGCTKTRIQTIDFSENITNLFIQSITI